MWKGEKEECPPAECIDRSNRGPSQTKYGQQKELGEGNGLYTKLIKPNPQEIRSACR